MRTYTEYLNTMTVKTLNVIARDMGLKGYSKLRKVELVAFIDDAIVNDCIDISADALHFAQYGVWPAEVKVLDVAVAADQPKIAAILRKIAAAPVTFSAAPVKPVQSAPVRVKVATPTATTESLVSYATDALIAAYRGYRATALKMGNTPTRVKIVLRAREIATILKSRKVNMRMV